MFRIKTVREAFTSGRGTSIEIHTEKQSLVRRFSERLKNILKRDRIVATFTEVDHLGRVIKKKRVNIPFVKFRGEELGRSIFGKPGALEITPSTLKPPRYFMEVKGRNYEIKYHGEIKPAPSNL